MVDKESGLEVPDPKPPTSTLSCPYGRQFETSAGPNGPVEREASRTLAHSPVLIALSRYRLPRCGGCLLE